VVPEGKPCLDDPFFLTTLPSNKTEFLKSISNFTVSDQRREMNVYNFYADLISLMKIYAETDYRTSKDVRCSSGKCGEDDICTPGINEKFNRGIGDSIFFNLLCYFAKIAPYIIPVFL